MAVFFGFFLIIVAISLFVLLCIFSRNDESVIPCAILGAIIIIFIIDGALILKNYYNPSIEPIDVYRNKTTLKITYRDSVAIDSVVVWKEGTK